MVRRLLYVGLLLYCISGAVGSLTKSLIVSLSSKWNSTSLIAEIRYVPLFLLHRLGRVKLCLKSDLKV
ncbi:unnamed protein product [Haemonchus placei]|uniref:Secreted protein n=1 Tax=Haemonchus placei TaxID=6290 RepID=A0A0N4X3A8_HAEPC|nr:unnamed protein product [Haemonchus placei]